MSIRKNHSLSQRNLQSCHLPTVQQLFRSFHQTVLLPRHRMTHLPARGNPVEARLYLRYHLLTLTRIFALPQHRI